MFYFFWIFYCQYRGSMNFLNSQSKSHFWILKLLVKLLFLLIFLFFFVHFVLLNYKFSRSLLQSTHQTSYILILHFCFHIFVLFFIILLFTTIFIIFSSHYKQHHLLFQIFLFCNFAYSCCLRLHFKKPVMYSFWLDSLYIQLS